MTTLLRQQLLADEKYRRVQGLFEREWKDSLDIQELTKEILMLHSIRQVLSLTLADEGLSRRLMEADLDNQKTRSRLTHIKLQINVLSTTVQGAFDTVQEYMLARYRDTFAEAEVKTKEERTRFVQTLPSFAEASAYVNELNRLWIDCDLVIGDCDQAGFTFKRLSEALDRMTQREFSR